MVGVISLNITETTYLSVITVQKLKKKKKIRSDKSERFFQYLFHLQKS